MRPLSSGYIRLKFSLDAEAAAWIDSHDSSAFMDDLEVVKKTISIHRTRRVKQAGVPRLNSDRLEQGKRVTKHKDSSRLTNNRPR